MIKIALLETIEALVSAINSKLLTKTEAESIYQPKASAINTGNIGSQSVSYASRAYRANNADEANELHGRATFSSPFPSQGNGSLIYYISASNYDGQPPADGAILYMGASGGQGNDHQAAFGNDGELYIKHMSNGTWQSWTRMAKASEIPSVSGFATEDWVTNNYYNLQEMDEHYYTMDDVDSMLGDCLKKSGGTMTGNLTLSNSSLIVGSRIYESKEYDSNLVFQKWMQGGTKKVYQFGYAADILSFGNGFAEMCADYLYTKGQIRTPKSVKIDDVVLEFNSSTNTLNIKGASGQTVHVAVNGTTIA